MRLHAVIDISIQKATREDNERIPTRWSNWSRFGWGIKPYGRSGGLRNFEADSFHRLEKVE
jgi:hypothetical protein